MCVSNIVLQVYEKAVGTFREIPHKQTLRTWGGKWFNFIPPHAFLIASCTQCLGEWFKEFRTSAILTLKGLTNPDKIARLGSEIFGSQCRCGLAATHQDVVET